jgi:hypothetical protein
MARRAAGMSREAWMFEHHKRPLLPRAAFLGRLLRFAGFAGFLVAVSLFIGVAGYHFVCGLSWIDSLYNAAMILTGMGPVNEITTVPGKLFASAYALFSGVAFLTIVAVLLAPAVHRFLHRLHLEMDEKASGDDRS